MDFTTILLIVVAQVFLAVAFLAKRQRSRMAAKTWGCSPTIIPTL